MEIYVKLPFTSIFSMILSNALILLVSLLQTQKVMTLLIRSHRIFNTELSYSCAHF